MHKRSEFFIFGVKILITNGTPGLELGSIFSPFLWWPDILPKDILPKDILPNGHFADGRFAERTFCRTDILPNGQFDERTT
jgi:hypothetical protein